MLLPLSAWIFCFPIQAFQPMAPFLNLDLPAMAPTLCSVDQPLEYVWNMWSMCHAVMKETSLPQMRAVPPTRTAAMGREATAVMRAMEQAGVKLPSLWCQVSFPALWQIGHWFIVQGPELPALWCLVFIPLSGVKCSSLPATCVYPFSCAHNCERCDFPFKTAEMGGLA